MQSGLSFLLTSVGRSYHIFALSCILLSFTNEEIECVQCNPTCVGLHELSLALLPGKLRTWIGRDMRAVLDMSQYANGGTVERRMFPSYYIIGVQVLKMTGMATSHT